MTEKTGIFGGAFDPPHNGHIKVAEEAVAQLKLRRLLIIPSFSPPHKAEAKASFDDRAELCRKAFGHIPCAEVSDIEREMGGTSYTINTLRELKHRFPTEQFYLIIGGDMLFEFEKWYRYEAILNECRVCAAARGSDSYADMMEYAAEIGKIRVLATEALSVSSTEVREKISAGEDVSRLIPDPVAQYIAEKKLYA